MKLILEWLDLGQIPIMATDPGMTCYYIHQENYDEPLEWSVARTGRRFPVQLFEERMDRFLKFLAKGLPTEGVLYLPLRSSFELEGLEGRYLLVGGAVFPFDLSDQTYGQTTGAVTPYSHVIEGDLAFIQRFCLLNTETEQPKEEVFQEPWNRFQLHQQQYAERQQQNRDAEARSLRLLLSCLDDTQKQELSDKKRFKVFGRDGQQYAVTYRQHGNVWLLNGAEEPVMAYCIVPDEPMPIYDQMLAQKLMLEYDLDSFLETANPSVVPPRSA